MAELTAIRPIDPDVVQKRPPSERNEVQNNVHRTSSHVELAPGITSRVNRQKCRIIKDTIVICLAFLLNFTAFQNLQNLQSSLNRVEGLGTVGLSTIYAALIISCLFLPPLMIKRFGCKWTMVCSLTPYAIYAAANFYATWWTIIPAAFLVGVGAANLWVAKCTYLTHLGRRFAKLTGANEEAMVNRFFGIFFMSFQSSQIWGNLISAFIFQSGPENGTVTAPESELARCGALSCIDIQRETNNTNLERPDPIKVYILCGTYVGLGVLAVLTVAFLLDQLHKVVPGHSDAGTSGTRLSCDLAVATVTHLRHINQILIIPLCIYSGLEQAFIAGDFTKNYVSCALGIWMVGLVLICFGVTDALCSVLFGRIVSYTGRVPIFVLGALVHCGLQVTLFLWQPHPNQLATFFIIAALWGLGDAVWQTQVNTLFGVIFPKTTEAAFANYRLWESVGFILAFAYSSFVCIYIKLYILLGFLILGMLGYFILEYRVKVHSSKKSVDLAKL